MARTKQEQMAIHRVLIRDDLRQFRQAVKPATHVRRLCRQPDACGGGVIQRRQCGQTDHAAPSSVRIRSISRSRSNPRLHQQATLAAKTNLDRPSRPHLRGRYLDERGLGRTVSLRWRAQPPFPSVEGTLGDSPFQTVGRDGEPAVSLAVNDLTPLLRAGALWFIHVASACRSGYKEKRCGLRIAHGWSARRTLHGEKIPRMLSVGFE